MSKEFLLGLAFSQETIQIEGKTFIVKEMDAGTSNKYEASLYKIVNNKPIYDVKNAKLKLVLLTLHDEQGNRVFAENDLGIIEQLPSHIVDEIFQVASSLNGLNQDEAEKN